MMLMARLILRKELMENIELFAQILSETRTEMEHGVYNFTHNGECVKCGSCCSNLLPLSASEIKDIKKYVKKHHIKEEKHFVPVSTSTMFDFTCPFLHNGDNEHVCVIYQVRPMVCRLFKCDQSREVIETNKRKLRGSRMIFDVRDTFFREKENK